jgi:outer membrane lipoprotein-sorting protein
VKLRFAATLAVCILTLLGVSAAFAQAPQPFSADFSAASANGSVNMKGKFYVSSPKLRVEMADPGQHQGGPFGGKMTMIIDTDAKMTYMLMTEQKMYMEFPQDAKSPMAQNTLRPQDFKADPCAGREGVTCKKVGTETVNGRSCDKWEATGKNGEKDTFWIDQKLHFPIKSQLAGGMTMQFTNIKEGAQDAALFKVPADFTKFDPAAMGRRPR